MKLRTANILFIYSDIVKALQTAKNGQASTLYVINQWTERYTFIVCQSYTKKISACYGIILNTWKIFAIS